MFNYKIKMILISLLLLISSPITTWAGLSQSQVSQLYVAIFGRASEQEGNQYWQKEYTDMSSAANAMLDCQAGRDYFGSSLETNQAFIEHIYKNTLNKTINDDPNGIAYWVGELNKESKGKVVSSLVNVISEYAPDGAYYNPNDQKAIDAYNQFTNRVKVSNYMADHVAKTPENWQVVTAFNKGLVVTYKPDSLSSAMKRVDDLATTSTEPNPSGSALKTKIQKKIQMLKSFENASPIMEEVGTIIEAVMDGDPSVVTINPPLETLENIDMANLPQQISIDFDFGSGYTPEESNSVYTGTGKILINNIALSQETLHITANATLTANQIKRDNISVLNGGISMGINITPSQSGNSIGIALDTNFQNLESLDQSANGGVSISTNLSIAEQKLLEPVKVQFNQLNTKDISVSGLLTITPKTENIYEANFDLTTQNGPIAGLLKIEKMADDSTKLTTPAGNIHMEEFDISIPGAIIIKDDDSSCNGSSTRGDIVVTDGKETTTIQLNGCDYTIN